MKRLVVFAVLYDSIIEAVMVLCTSFAILERKRGSEGGGVIPAIPTTRRGPKLSGAKNCVEVQRLLEHFRT